MSVSIYEGCACCQPCCGVSNDSLWVDLENCADAEPDPIELPLEFADESTKFWSGLFTCGDCDFDINVVCYKPTLSDTWLWTAAIQRDSGPPSCNRCTDEELTAISTTCSPLEMIFETDTLASPGCTDCACDPATGPIRLIVIQ